MHGATLFGTAAIENSTASSSMESILSAIESRDPQAIFWVNTRAAFRALLCVRFITSLIIWVDFTLLFTLLSYQWRASPFVIGLTVSLYGLPGLILGPWIGALADHSDPINFLRRSYWARAAASIGLVTSPNLFAFMAFAVCQGASNLGVMPSEQILIKRTLSTDWMVKHARYTGVFDQLAKIAAPLVGAALSHKFGARLGYLVSASLVLPATVCLGALARLPGARQSGPPGSRGASRSLSILLGVLRRQTDYRLAFFAMLLQTTVLGIYDPLLALFLRQIGMPVETFGIIVAATACGGAAAAAALRKLPEIHRATQTECLIAGFGLSVLVPGLLVSLGLRPPLSAWVLLWLVNGYCYASTALRFAVTQQAQCPAHCLGMAAATARSTQLAALVCGPLLGSTLASVVGIPMILMVAGSSAVVCAVAFRARRTLLEDGKSGTA